MTADRDWGRAEKGRGEYAHFEDRRLILLVGLSLNLLCELDDGLEMGIGLLLLLIKRERQK